MSLNAATVSLRVNGFHPCGVQPTAKRDPPGSSWWTARRSSSTSKAPTGPLPPGVARFCHPSKRDGAPRPLLTGLRRHEPHLYRVRDRSVLDSDLYSPLEGGATVFASDKTRGARFRSRQPTTPTRDREESATTQDPTT